MLVSWDDEAHAVGYALIEEGRHLIADVLALIDHEGTSCDQTELVGDCLRTLACQLALQFQHEEAVMMLLGSANLGDHRHEHRRILDTLAQLRRRHEDGDDAALANLPTILFSHLRGVDSEEFGAPPRQVA